jgi:single-strand DNA-binding protein
MTMTTVKSETSGKADSATVNEVHLIGRLSGREHRVLPSGAPLLSFRVIVDRPPRDRGPSGLVRVDALECCVWRVALARRIENWDDGEPIEVHGVLRRRFWQSGAGLASRVEVEVRSARRVAA